MRFNTNVGAEGNNTQNNIPVYVATLFSGAFNKYQQSDFKYKKCVDRPSHLCFHKDVAAKRLTSANISCLSCFICLFGDTVSSIT